MEKINKEEIDLDDFDIDFGNIETEAEQIDLEAEQIDLEAEQIDLEAEQIDLEAEQIDLEAEQIDLEAPKEQLKEQTDKNVQSEEDLKNYSLYLITDKYASGMLNYMRNYGANVSKIFTSVIEARDVMLMQVEPSRLVVIDTGTGKFTNMTARNALVDLMGICDNDTKISMFYTDSIIKSEVTNSDEVDGKLIQWHKYRSTADVLAHILQNKSKENYIYDIEETEEATTEDVLDIQGLNVTLQKSISLGQPVLRLEELIMHIRSETPSEDEIEKYTIKI